VGLATIGTSFTSAGTYYSSTNWDIDNNINFDTSDGDIEMVVDGELDIDGDISISGDNQVRFYVKGDVIMDGNPAVNTGGDPENLVMLVHSTADKVSDGGTPQFTGYIYAPNSDFEINGNGAYSNNVLGGVVANNIDAQTGTIRHVNPDFQLEIGQGVNALTFLHISTNPVTVTGS
jgi:hypothetical protein